MRKILLLTLLFISSFVPCLFGQTTNVTATVTYPDGFAFANGTVQAIFTPPTGIIDQGKYLLNGAPFPYNLSGTLDGTGTFNLILTDDHKVQPQGGRWSFTVCSPATVPCTISLQDVFGTSINLSGVISADAAPIKGVALTINTFFADSEVQANAIGGQIYFNYTTKQLRCWDGSVFTNCLGGGGGGGTVTNFASNNLSPLFTTNVTNSTTTPVLSFALSQAPAHTVYSNYTGASANPQFNPLTFLGNTTQVATTTGTYIPTHCITIDANFNLVDSGSSCSSSGATPGGPQFSIQFNNPLNTFDGVSALTTDVLGNVNGLSYTANGPSGGFLALGQGVVPTFTKTNYAYFYADTSIPTTFGTAMPETPGTVGQVLGVTGVDDATHIHIGYINAGTNPNALYRVCMMPVGANNGAPVNADLGPQYFLCAIPYGATLVEIDVQADAGTPNVTVGRNRAGTRVNFTSTTMTTGGAGAQVCANAAGSGVGLMGTTCTKALQNTALNAGDYLELITGAVSTAKNIGIAAIFQVN